jgi:hypothetical protein
MPQTSVKDYESKRIKCGGVGLTSRGKIDQSAAIPKTERNDLMTQTSRAVVLLGEGKWELRELPVPAEPPPGDAILRVDATGMCHSDIDNLHGIVHTPGEASFPRSPDTR